MVQNLEPTGGLVLENSKKDHEVYTLCMFFWYLFIMWHRWTYQPFKVQPWVTYPLLTDQHDQQRLEYWSTIALSEPSEHCPSKSGSALSTSCFLGAIETVRVSSIDVPAPSCNVFIETNHLNWDKRVIRNDKKPVLVVSQCWHAPTKMICVPSEFWQRDTDVQHHRGKTFSKQKITKFFNI